MTEQLGRFGVCTLRVEVQPEHLLITVHTNLYLAPGARRPTTPQIRNCRSVREALEATEEFLESFGTWEKLGTNGSH
jgi:hypothetical protein